MTQTKPTGVLPNSYVPPLRSGYLVSELARLKSNSLFDLVDLWLAMRITQPKPTRSQLDQGITAEKLVEDIKGQVDALRQSGVRVKGKLIDRIIVDFYPDGLNALQLAQVDIQLMMDKPNNYRWVSSTAKVLGGNQIDDFILSLDSKTFLDHLVASLASLYLTHIYISKHPQLPLILVRIQMYEFIHLKKSRKRTASDIADSTAPDVISRRPYYLAIPTSSPHLIHSLSNDDDLTAKLILQAVEETLSTSYRPVRLVRSHEKPLKGIESMHILKGVSRFGDSLGSWAAYADNVVDVNPLGADSDHILLNPTRTGEVANRQQAIAALRFKGSIARGKESLYEGSKKARTDASIVPIQTAEYCIQTPVDDHTPSIRLRLFGHDIFAGMQQLAVDGTVDATKVPGWLTGEEGLATGTVTAGKFNRTV